MKRTALIFLTAIYLLSLVGIGVNRFYCCGKLTSVNFTLAASDHTDKDNCCKHESKNFKIKDSHVTVVTTVLGQSAPAILPAPVYLPAVDISLAENDRISYQAHAPPGNPAVQIYTLNCAYRI